MTFPLRHGFGAGVWEAVFTTLDPFAATMASFATYAVAFRPAARRDRLRALLGTRWAEVDAGDDAHDDGLGHLCHRAAAHYQQAGIIAPTLLVLLRFVQGFGVGGEWGGAV